jgi:ubiquinone/menaquinone biosynthesis C-methylase UbiE
MGQEIDLLADYPRTKRDVETRASEKTENDRAVARRFGAEFFDGERRHGYGGFNYHPRFWQPVVPAFRKHFKLNSGSSVLDVGCAKGFMMRDFAAGIPGIAASGVDISQYAIDHALEDMKPYIQVANATELPFPDKSFDVVISINTIHNLAKDELALALGEISRVSRRGAYITVDAYHDDDDDERERMMAWNLTAKTIMSVGQWKAFFAEIGYEGDYYWFIP